MSRLELKYFDPCIVELPGGHIIEAKVAKDGLIYILPADANVCATLTVCHPVKDAYGWFFNNTRDRYIAEIHGDEIYINPRFIARFCEVA
jgi:hypothetical protein